MYIEDYIHRLKVRCLLENIVILFSVVWLLACIFFYQLQVVNKYYE